MKKTLKIILSLSILVIVFSCIANSQNKGESLTMTEKAKNKYNELLKRDASITKTNDADLESIFNNFLYADVYNHGTLDPKLRELVTLVSLTASQGTDMIKDHVEIALNVGASPIEIKEALYQCSPYVGFPRVFAALEKANELVTTRIHAKLEDIVRAMNGIITPFQKNIMKKVMKHIDELTERIKEMDDLIDEYMKEYEKSKKKLEKMPGLGKRSSEIILAEIGQDMNRFPTAGHISSWAGVCPGNNESAGKRRSGKSRKGNKILKSTLVECAQSAVRRKDTFFYAQYQRISMRRGKKRAILAVAHSILIAIYYMLKEDKEYEDLGADFYNKFNKEKKANAYMKKLKELGYNVQIVAHVS